MDLAPDPIIQDFWIESEFSRPVEEAFATCLIAPSSAGIVSKQERDGAFEQIEKEHLEYFEGKRVSESGYRVERNKKARDKCLKLKGYDCAVCGFNFFKRYGELGLNFIHVHHVEDLVSAEDERKVDPKTGLVPV